MSNIFSFYTKQGATVADTNSIDNVNKPRRQLLELLLTEFCNLDCSYCYEHKAQKDVMPLNIAQKAIIEAFLKPGFDELEIDFFGGEPFVAFMRIQEICEWVWSQQWPKPYVFFTSTNGTLVHGKIQEWLRQNKDRLVVGLSLDGTPEMHDTNRSASFSRIDIDFFKNTWPSQVVKMTISPATISCFAGGIKYITGRGLSLTANTAGGVAWNDEHFEYFANQLREVADFYLDNPLLTPVNIIDMRIDIAAATINDSKERLKNYCGSGVAMSAVAPDGKQYPCQTFMPMTTRKAIPNIDEIFLSLRSEANDLDPKCRECPILATCPTCYGLNFVASGSPFLRSIGDCTLQKLRAMGTAYLWAEMIINRDRDYVYIANRSDTEIAFMIKAVQFINERLAI